MKPLRKILIYTLQIRDKDKDILVNIVNKRKEKNAPGLGYGQLWLESI